MPLQGPQKYLLFATAHGQAGVQYKARSSELRKTGDVKGANKHARIGRLHDAASKALAKIAKAHTKEQERGVQALKMQKQMAPIKEELEGTNMIEENLNSMLQASLDRKPIDFKKSFEELIRERVSQKVADLKVAVAQETFAVEEEVVDEGKTFKRDDEGEEKREKFEKRRKERHKREVVDEEVEVVDEEAEELDEVSSELAKRYLAKAEPDYHKTQEKIAKGDPDRAGDYRKRSKKRFAGIERASFKEELDGLNDILEGLSEDQIEALQVIFSKKKD